MKSMRFFALMRLNAELLAELHKLLDLLILLQADLLLDSRISFQRLRFLVVPGRGTFAPALV